MQCSKMALCRKAVIPLLGYCPAARQLTPLPGAILFAILVPQIRCS